MHFTQWCEKTWPGLLDWLESCDRGASPEAIVEVVVGIPSVHAVLMAPADESDFRRCDSLLHACPSLVAHLGAMSRISPEWAKAVAKLRKSLSK